MRYVVLWNDECITTFPFDDERVNKDDAFKEAIEYAELLHSFRKGYVEVTLVEKPKTVYSLGGN